MSMIGHSNGLQAVFERPSGTEAFLSAAALTAFGYTFSKIMQNHNEGEEWFDAFGHTDVVANWAAGLVLAGIAIYNRDKHLRTYHRH